MNKTLYCRLQASRHFALLNFYVSTLSEKKEENEELKENYDSFTERKITLDTFFVMNKNYIEMKVSFQYCII